ncbi:unnamed protein product [Effrenium voratum]|nr:unnamed protein product [Effrenium voratum]
MLRLLAKHSKGVVFQGPVQGEARRFGVHLLQRFSGAVQAVEPGPGAEMESAERAFEAMSAQGGTGDVYIAHVLEKAEREQEVIFLGAFKSRRDAARALVDRAKHEFAQAMQRAYEDNSYQEPTFLLEGDNFSLLVEDAMLQQFKVTGVPLA